MKTFISQFYDLKKKRPDAICLFRCGDFYETYSHDAETTSEILGITPTRSTTIKDRDGSPLLMAAFPYHALDAYLPKLIRAGQRVAICDQIETPKPYPEPPKQKDPFSDVCSILTDCIQKMAGNSVTGYFMQPDGSIVYRTDDGTDMESSKESVIEDIDHIFHSFTAVCTGEAITSYVTDIFPSLSSVQQSALDALLSSASIDTLRSLMPLLFPTPLSRIQIIRLTLDR